ncbi:MAG: tetratricopeptide repeat protein [Lewinellaceae bacterium]|nr:tetratricopeptide repeat protein [Lewinellaceae bacterium]
MNKKASFILAIVFLSQWALAQRTVADSLAALLPTLSDGNEKIEVLNQLVKLHLNSDLGKARDYASQAERLSRKTGNRLALASAFKDIGVIHLIASNFDSSRYYNQLARREYEALMKNSGQEDRSKILEGYAGTLSNTGNWYYYQSALDSAVYYHQQSVEFSDQHGIGKPKAISQSTLAYIYQDQSQYEKAIAMHFDALHTFEKLENQDGISRSYQGIGEVYCEYLNKCELAIDYYRKALKIKKELGSERGMAYVFRLLGGAYEDMSVTDSAHYYYSITVQLAEKLNDKRLLIDGYSALASIAKTIGLPNEECIEINRKYIQVAQEIGRLDGILTGYSNLGRIYADAKDPERAIDYNNKAIVLADSLKDYDILQDLYFREYAIFRNQLHDTAKALLALEAYLVNHDSVTNAERFRAVEDISTKYETEKKEATIAKQQEALQQGRVRFWLITGILGIALAAGALLFRLARKLRKRNEEKEFLIKEIHHRVKNNLQVLSSLLHLQSRHIKDEMALDAVREGQNRVEAMSLIHQKLYMGDNLAAVEMRDYLHNLGDTLLDSFGMEDGPVQIIYHLEPMRLDVDTAIPLGLIINELVTNSLKYAFPDGRSGQVEISLWKNDSGKLNLTVADNGVGKAGAQSSKSSTSFGASLVEMLSKKLKGKPVVSHENGYATLIEFGVFKEA